MSLSTRSLAAGSAALLTCLGLSGCAGPTGSEASGSTSPGTSAPCPVTIADPWVKAVDAGMTAAFGTLSNPSGEAVTITAAHTPDAGRVELHEVVDAGDSTAMRPVAGGFEVPAGSSLILEPGGLHLMLMGVTDPIEPGQDVTFTLDCSSGGTVAFTAQAKTFAGAGEEYAPS